MTGLTIVDHGDACKPRKRDARGLANDTGVTTPCGHGWRLARTEKPRPRVWWFRDRSLDQEPTP